MVDVVIELAKDGVLSVLLCADDLVRTSGTMEGHRNKFLEWKEAIANTGWKVNVLKTKVMVSGGCMPKNTVDPCGVCILRVKVTQFHMCSVASESMVDVLKRKSQPQSVQQILLAENVKGILERQ